jgi:hypothetical protein
MNAELAGYSAALARRLDRFASLVESMNEAQLNARPTPDGNSPWVIATHVAGNARAWTVGIIAGEHTRRDRPAEFASTGSDGGELAARVRETREVAVAKLESLDPARLDVVWTPPQELWGEGPAREISVRGAILHVIEHASLHLGHLELTRDLTEAASTRA